MRYVGGVSVDLTEWAPGDFGGLAVAVVSLDLSENLLSPLSMRQ